LDPLIKSPFVNRVDRVLAKDNRADLVGAGVHMIFVVESSDFSPPLGLEAIYQSTRDQKE